MYIYIIYIYIYIFIYIYIHIYMSALSPDVLFVITLRKAVFILQTKRDIFYLLRDIYDL